MKFRNLERAAQEEAELERLEEEYRLANGGEPKNPPEEDPLNAGDNIPAKGAEELTWKKRHGDLRSYTQKQLNDKDREIAELKKELGSVKANPNFPADLAEAEAWVKEYPDLARVIGTLIDQRAETRISSVTDEVRDVRTQLEAERAAFQRERALSEILKVHPDFLELINQDDFKTWVEEQPGKRGMVGQTIYDSLYNNETDALSAIESVRLYKSEKKSQKHAPQDAAASVRRTPAATPPSSGDKKTFSESEIERMKPWEYDRLEEEIEAARREGRIVYDISGAAR